MFRADFIELFVSKNFYFDCNSLIICCFSLWVFFCNLFKWLKWMPLLATVKLMLFLKLLQMHVVNCNISILCYRCPFLHRTAGDTERRYHLRYYKTGSCIHETDAKGHCSKNGSHCAFAHGSHDLRSPVYDIRCNITIWQPDGIVFVV